MNIEDQTKKIIELFLQIGTLIILLILSFKIMEPMLLVGIWAVIIAVGTYPLHKKLSNVFKGNEKISAIIITGVLLFILLMPVGIMATNAAKTLESLADLLEKGKLTVPRPTQEIKDIPMIGEKIYESWYMASTNMGEVLNYAFPHIKNTAPKVLSFAKNMGISMFQTIISICMAGFFILYGNGAKKISDEISEVLMKGYISNFTGIACGTIRSVVQGIIGVGVIQGLAAGIALSLADVPAAGILTLLTMFLCVVQLPPMIVLIPVAIYLFITNTLLTAILFSIWVLVITFGDTPLRALLFGRGLEVPSMVIFVGTIGGVLSWGIVGLFVGAVVLSLGYKFVEVLIKDENSKKNIDIKESEDDLVNKRES